MDEAVRQPAGDAGFLAGGGEMGALLRAHDWEASPLGAPQGWPQPLKTLAGLMLAANQPMFVAWGRGRTLLYNDAYAEILASKHPAALGRDFLEVWHEIRADLLPIVEQAYAGRPVHMDDIALTMERRGYPEETHFAFSYTPVRDEAGAVAGFLCPCVEITEQVLAERRRAFRLAFEERLRDLADPDAIMAEAVAFLGRRMGFDRVGYSEIVGGRVVRARGSFAASGMAPLNEDFPIESFGEAMVARQRQGVTEVNGDVLAGPERADEVWAAIGTRSFVSVPLVREERLVASLYVNNRAPRRWSPDEVALIEEVAARTWDAVERARAETALRELNETLEARVAERTAERDRTWRLSQDLLVVVKPDGTLAAVNEAWTAALGWEERELVGRTFMELAHPDDVEPAFKVFTATFETPLTEPYEFRLRHRSGEHRWIAWTAAFEDGRVFANGRDVTAERARAAELALAQEQLRQSQKMEAVGQLTGGLAHDFNNLLAGLSGSLEMMEARIAQGRVAEVERYLAAAQGAARRAAALTHRLLAFSRRQTLEPKPTDVNRLVADMEELIRRTVGPAVRVEAVAAAGLWPTLVDPHQLENALLNLCLNARDAMPGGGTITVETANRPLDERAARERDLAPGQYVSLCVSDTGTGMTPEVARRAFDPFFTTKPLGEGTGLGLSMIYGFARQSEGQVRIRSEPGRGTTVCLYLPRHHGQEAGDGPEPAPEAAPLGADTGKTVLVIEDEALVRMVVVDLLEEMGLAAIEAGDGPEGLAVLRSEARVDLLITDVGLPGGMNGRQVAEAARALRPALRVLFVTGYAENAVLSHGHLDPGMAIVTKPFDLARLTSRIREMIASP